MNEELIKKNATYEDLYTIPKNMIGEIINGQLYAMPRPSPRHSNVSSIIGWQIIGPFRFGLGGPGGWIILDEPEIQLGQDIFVPDLAAWKKERLPRPPTTNYIAIPPDWICEVLSPSTAIHDRTKKMPIYAQSGVAYLWLIHPIDKTVEIFGLDAGKWVFISAHGDKDKVRAEPFKEIEIDIATFWWD
ncbi:MAG: Uma2 family endonuclease [Desulfobacterales bacterium]|nr:Uma2 family endonuclease [Desulfobacterales bacterium]